MDPAADILRAVRQTIGDGPRYLQRPDIGKGEIGFDGLFELDTIEVFELQLRAFTKARYAIAVQSGSAALTLALAAAGVGQGDEVLVPSLTFCATPNAIVQAGAVPHFVDVNHETLGIHPFKLRQYIAHGIDDGLFALSDDGVFNLKTDARIAAVVPVHMLGIPCFIDEIILTATYYGMKVIEDAAEALGSYTHLGDHCGVVGEAGALSFNWNKMVTTCGGGAVITNDEKVASTVRHLAHEAKVKHPFLYQHDAVGWNFCMSSLNAAIGIGQMTRLGRTLEKKATLALRYGYAFKDIRSATIIGKGNYWLNACMLDPRCVKRNDLTGARDRVLQTLIDDGFEARAIFTPMHMMEHFKEMPRQPSLETCEDIFRRCVCLPSTVC